MKQHFGINVFEGLSKACASSLIFRRQGNYSSSIKHSGCKGLVSGFDNTCPLQGLSSVLYKKKFVMQQPGVQFCAENESPLK